MIKPFNSNNVKKYLKGNYYISQLPFEDKRIQTWTLLNLPTQVCLTCFLLFAQVSFPACRLCYWAKEVAT